jgi:hypothetical protein
MNPTHLDVLKSSKAPYGPVSPKTSGGRRLFYALWTVMALATISVIFYSEIPLLRQPQERVALHALRWILLPHAIAGTTAFICGPLQFSSRVRRRSLAVHRIVGRLYVVSVLIAAPLAVLSTIYAHYPKAMYFKIAIGVQATAWAGSTLVGFILAVRRRIAMHREWMIRSYAVTFTFVATRMFQPIPAWNHLGRFGFASAIVCFTLVALLTPQIASILRSLVVGTTAYKTRSKTSKLIGS